MHSKRVDRGETALFLPGPRRGGRWNGNDFYRPEKSAILRIRGGRHGSVDFSPGALVANIPCTGPSNQPKLALFRHGRWSRVSSITGRLGSWSGLAWIAMSLAAFSCWGVVAVVNAQQTRPESPPAAELKNSTQKLRVQPSRIAQRIGTAVRWRETLDEALAESAKSGKPVFWYVNTVPETFTDRKVEIDRYMLAGPFSWPKIIGLLNDQFVPVRQPPDADSAARFDLQPYKFVEPGFLIVGSDGQVQGRVDHLTTLPPDWLLHLIRGWASSPATAEAATAAAEATESWEAIWDLPADAPALLAFRRGMAAWPADLSLEDEVWQRLPAEPANRLQLLLMRGMLEYYQGRHDVARETWRAAIEAAPEHPLAWKAAAEREGFGPFVRGFETHRELPSAARTAGRQSVGSAAPNDCYPDQAIWERSAQFLLGMQRSDGAWVDSDYDFGGTDSLPNVYVAVTSLVGLSLLQAKDRLPARSADIDAALDRAAAFVRDPKHINLIDRDEILWAHAYRLRFLAERYRRGQEELDTVNQAVQSLESVQGTRGSWYHEYSNSFVTATALVALARAKEVGASVDMQVVERGLQSLLRDRFANGAFPYSNGRGNRDNRQAEGNIPASAGRMPICELALWLWQQSDDARLQFAVEQSLLHHDKLQVAYKYDNHTSTLSYGGFFFWYDMESRAEAIGHLADVAWRESAAKQHRKRVLGLPEVDGCFVDSHELGRCYGTAMGLLSLGSLQDVLSDTTP